MNTTNYIRIFRGDDSDALGYQTIVGTIKTDIDLAGCKAVFRFLGFYAEFNPIPEDKKLTIVIPAQASRGFPPGVGYASLKIIDAYGKIRTFTNRIPVIVDTMTPSCGCGEFEVSFSPFPELEPLKIFIGPNADDFDQYTGFISKIIDRASLVRYGLVMLADAMGEDGGASGKAASPLAVKAAYDAIIATLTDNYYNAEQTEEAIDRVAAYYITYTAAGAAFPTYAALANATTVYSGGKVRVPTRNDYCVVLADETHGGAEYRYIYAVAEGETTGSWQPQFPVEGVMTVDQTVQKNSQNPVSGDGIWAALWGALASLPTGFTSLYDWCVAQLAGKASTADATLTERGFSEWNILHTPLTAEQKAAFYDEDPTTAENDYAVTIRDTHLYVGEYWAADIVTSSDGLSATYDRGGVEAGEIWGPEGTVVATRTALQGYQLGSQTDKPLQIAGDYATKSQVDNKLDKSSEVWTVSYTDDGLHIADTAGVYYIDISPGGVKTNNPEAHNVYWPRSRGSLARLEDIAGTFSSSTTYAKDALVEHLGVLYRCVNPNGHTGAWVDADFTPATVEDVLAALRTGKADVSAIPYDRITITTGQLQDHAEQKVTLNAATTTLALPALTDLTGKVSDFGIDMVNGYAPDGTPTAASFQLDGTLGTDYNLIVPDGEDWSEMSTLAAGEMAVYYFTLSAFQIGDLPTWGVLKQVVTLVPVPVAP